LSNFIETKLSINKKYGQGTVFSFGDVGLGCRSIPTGISVLDKATGIGGLPVGRIVELYGPESCGKSTVLLHTAVNAQKQGLAVLYEDFENALDRKYAEALGLDLSPEKFGISQPADLEQGMAIAEEFIKSNSVGLIIVDSLAAMRPRAEMQDAKGHEREIGDKIPLAAQGHAMAEVLRRLTPEISKSNVCMCFINQIRQDLAAAQRGITKYTTPGSKTLRFYASMRIEFRKIGSVRGKVENPNTGDLEDYAAGIEVEANICKNKVAPPFSRGVFYLRHGKGACPILNTIQLSISRGFIEAGKAGWYSLPKVGDFEGEKVRGMEGVLNYYETHKEVFDLLKEGVDSLVCYKKEDVVVSTDSVKEIDL